MLFPLTLWTQLAAIKKQLVETWDKINNFITFPPYYNNDFLSLDI